MLAKLNLGARWLGLLLGLSVGCSSSSPASDPTQSAAGSGGVAGAGDAQISGAAGSAPTAGTSSASGASGELAGAAGSSPSATAGSGAEAGATGGSAGSEAAAGGALGSAGNGGAPGLIHPGGLHTEADLERVRSQVAAGAEPWSSAWSALKSSEANANYQPNVTATETDAYAIQNQGHAAYVLAIKWVASGDPSYATAAIRVIDAWVDTVKVLQGTTLRTGIGATQLANAAEILAHGFHGGSGWSSARVSKARSWFGDVIWPVICHANAQRSSNWGTSAMAGCMSTAIFSDDPVKYAYAVDAYRHGFSDAPDGCSGVAQYISEPSGQPTEAGRDQGHAQGGVAHLVEVAAMAWNQGLDLVSYSDQRLVAGMEYLAKYNLGGTVPYDANFPDPCNVHPSWATISDIDRGSFSPIYELANKLFDSAKVAHPFTTQVLAAPGYVPEQTNSDHVGLGTLTAR
jgi:Alginate lyase